MSEIRTFTKAQMMDPNAVSPPCWREPNSLPAIVADLGYAHSWAPTLSVSVFRDHPDRQGGIQTLTLKRNRATTHRKVLSTLTSTFPAQILPELVKRQERYLVGAYPKVAIGAHGPDPRESAVVATYAPQLEGVPDTTNLLPFLCHDIMSRKLGRPDLISMQTEDELGTVSLARMAVGVSCIGEDKQNQPRYERLLLAGLALMLHPHQSHVFDPDIHERMSVLPPEERRYSRLGWTDIEPFPQAVRSKRAIDLAPYMPEGEAVMICAYGQCLAMTSELIQGPDLLAHLGKMSVAEVDYDGQLIGDPYGFRAYWRDRDSW